MQKEGFYFIIIVMIANSKKSLVTGMFASIIHAFTAKSEIEPIIVQDNNGGYAIAYIENVKGGEKRIPLTGKKTNTVSYSLCVQKNNKIIGTVYFDEYSSSAFIRNIDVELAEAGKGICQLMMSIAMDFLTKNRNITDITLVADGSEISKHIREPSRVDKEKHHYDLVKLYEKFGFVTNSKDNDIDFASTMNYCLKRGYPPLESSKTENKIIYQNIKQISHGESFLAMF